MDEHDGRPEDEVVRVPITDVIDLHAFHPRDIRAVVEEYVVQCRERGLTEVRIIHGRGTGTQRALVRSVLARSPHVLAFGDAGPERGGWGATLVSLKLDEPGGGP